MARGRGNTGQRPWESWPEAVRVLARGRARGIFPGPVNVALLALELVSPSRSLPVDSLSRSSEGGSEGTQSRAPFPCMPDTPAVLSSVVVCGRLTLLSYSKIFLLHHDPPLHTDWPTPAMVSNLPGLRGGRAKPCSKPKPSCSYLDPRVRLRRPLELAAP